MGHWTVDLNAEVSCKGDPRAVSDRVMRGLEHMGYDAVLALGDDQAECTLTVEAADAAAAVPVARGVVVAVLTDSGVEVGRVVHLDVADPDAEPPLHAALPELAGVAEAAEILDVSKTRVGQLAESGALPAPLAESGPLPSPLAELAATPVWAANALRTVAGVPRRAGRPRKPSSGSVA
jgi:hypothetical protein